MSLVTAQDPAVWRDSYTERIFQLLLNYTIHPKPKVCSCVLMQLCVVSSFMLNYPHKAFVTDAATLISVQLTFYQLDVQAHLAGPVGTF